MARRRKSAAGWIVTVIMLALVIVILLLLVQKKSCNTENSDMTVKLKSNGVTQETLEFEELGLYPGQEKEYTLLITCEETGVYTMDFIFVEVEDHGLKTYVDVSVTMDGETLESGKLDALLSGEKFTLETEFSKTQPVEIRIVYSMSLEIGNEAQGVSALFNLKIEANKK